MRQIYTMFAGYNRWANRRLYAAARTLSDADYRSPRGAFFGSLHGTLNHLVVADRVHAALNRLLNDTLVRGENADGEGIIWFARKADETGKKATFPAGSGES